MAATKKKRKVTVEKLIAELKKVNPKAEVLLIDENERALTVTGLYVGVWDKESARVMNGFGLVKQVAIRGILKS